MKSYLQRPVSKGSSGPTSGLHSSRRWRTTYRNEATLASIWAAGRAVALQKGGSPGSLGCCGAERGRKHLRQARPQRHGRAACLFGAGPEQPQRGANAGRRGGERPSGRPAAGRERRLNGLRSHQKSPLSKMTLRLVRLRSDDYFFDARTSWGECSFGMFQATLSRPSSRELRPFYVESSPPAAVEVQSASHVQSPIPSRAQ